MQTVMIASAICTGVYCGFQNCKTIIEEVRKEIVKIGEKNEIECESYSKNINNQKMTSDSIATEMTELTTDQVTKKNTPRKPPCTFESLHTKSIEKNDNNLQQTLTISNVHSETSDDYKRSEVYVIKIICKQCDQTLSERGGRFQDISVETDKHSNNDALLTSNESQEQLIRQIPELRNKKLRFLVNSTESEDSYRRGARFQNISVQSDRHSNNDVLLTSNECAQEVPQIPKLRNKKIRLPLLNSTESGDSYSQDFLRINDTRFMNLPDKMKKEIKQTVNDPLTSTKIPSKSSRFCKLCGIKYLAAGLHRLFNKINNK